MVRCMCVDANALLCQPCDAAGSFPAYSVVKHGAPLELVHYPMPTAIGTQVLIRTKYAGICHSDLHLIEGSFDLGNGDKIDMRTPSHENPYTVGHEFEGVIVGAGEKVPMDSFDLGKSYAVFPWIGCDLPEECVHCRAGNTNLCGSPKTQRFTDGASHYGGYASFILVPHYKYLIDYSGVLPEGLGCVYMCSGLTAYSALEAAHTSRNPPVSGSDLLILGCGGLGFQALSMARAKYGAPIACDVSDEKLTEAAKLGCATFNSSQQEAIHAIWEFNKGGVAAVIDFVGNETSQAFAKQVIRRGGKLVIVGLMGGEFKLPLPLIPMLQYSIEGVMVGNMRQVYDMLELLRTGQVPLVPHQFRSINDVNSALTDLYAGKIMGRCILKHDWFGFGASRL
eukprot:TRINITY_DN37864_c0_g1_i1.p1 TRINITY_DN37864_c0_g1~~TRINITY_DN37864_c0_g1_i1.p1  ORF type:complete len:395 (-),score=26.51 TRINITY_DN37864_c0_g1_i1:93-1277(-)